MLGIRPRLAATAAVLTLGPLALATLYAFSPGTIDPRELHRYAADDLRLEKKGPPDVVFIGDSLTEHWQTVAPETWEHSWINRGIGGERSSEIRARFAQDVLALHPTAVHVQTGINDIGGTRDLLKIAETEANVAAMASRARAAGIHVVLGTVEPIPPWAWRTTNGGEGSVERLNAWIRAYAARTNASVADYWAVMDPGMTSDGVHPTAAGYAEMAHVAHKALAKS